MNELVPYEGSRTDAGDAPAGNTDYEFGWPGLVNGVYDHNANRTGVVNADFPTHSSLDIDYEIGGETGEMDRFPYIINGIPTFDNHDFRGDHPLIPVNSEWGSYGEGGDAEDHNVIYSQAVASMGWPEFSQAESWADMTGAI